MIEMVDEMPNQIAEKLHIMQKRQSILGLAFLVIYLSLLTTIGYWVFAVTNQAYSMNVFFAIYAAVLLGYPALHVLKFVFDHVEKRWAPGYCIEECEDVLKLWGPVRVSRLAEAQAQLLSLRPNYTLAEFPFERFGCTLAAVPVSADFL